MPRPVGEECRLLLLLRQNGGMASSLSEQPLSPLDGRYRVIVSPLAEHLSEAGLNRARIQVEVEWLLFLTDAGVLGGNKPSAEQARSLRRVAAEFGPDEIEELAVLEAGTRHDVKAVELFVRRRLADLGVNAIAELTHFGCTSEDINNLAYALTVRSAVNAVWLPALRQATEVLRGLAVEHRNAVMLARTHGQAATPTTMGKELSVFVRRLDRLRQQVEAVPYLGKFSGATGTFAAHQIADPSQDWANLSRDFVTSLGLEWNPLTTQIEPHDWQVELYSRMIHVNRVLHNLCTDLWTYISLGYFRQLPVIGATGSSTMPHKVNPIRFENAEANFELSNAILASLAETLATSRLQRDLTDSTTQRNIGVGIGHSLLAIDNVHRGLAEIELDPAVLTADLDGNWEVLAEAIQMVIRAEVVAGRSSIANPYDLLKELTRGKRVDRTTLRQFIDGLDIGADAKRRLTDLEPRNYVGLAAELTGFIDREPS